MAHRKTTQGVSGSAEEIECARKLVELNKEQGRQPQSFSLIAMIGVQDYLRKNVPRLKRAGIAIPESIKSKK